MKTRNGFVSNSSSSSFIAIATQDAFNEALSRLEDERDRKLVKILAEQEKAFGKDVMIIKEFCDAGGFSSIWGCDFENKQELLEKAGIVFDENDEDNDDDTDWMYESLSNYFSIIEKMREETKWKDKVLTQDVGDGG